MAGLEGYRPLDGAGLADYKPSTQPAGPTTPDGTPIPAEVLAAASAGKAFTATLNPGETTPAMSFIDAPASPSTLPPVVAAPAPTPKWAEISKTPKFLSLAPEQRELLRNQYFRDFVAPNVPTEQLEAVKESFDKGTRLSHLDRFGQAAGAVVDTAKDFAAFTFLPKGSVMEGMDGKTVTTDSTASPVAPLNRLQYNKVESLYNLLTPEKRAAAVASINAERATPSQRALLDVHAKAEEKAKRTDIPSATDTADTREARINRYVQRGIDAGQAEILTDKDIERGTDNSSKAGPILSFSERVADFEKRNLGHHDAQQMALRQIRLEKIGLAKPRMGVADLGDAETVDQMQEAAKSGYAKAISGGLDALWGMAQSAEQPGSMFTGTPLEPAARSLTDIAHLLVPKDKDGRAVRIDLAKRMEATAATLAPELQGMSYDAAYNKGKVLPWMLVQASTQSPQIAGLLATIVLPELAPFTLPMMGVTAGGNQYAENIKAGVPQNKAALDALINGGVEIGSEAISLGLAKVASPAFKALLDRLPAQQRQALAASLMARFAAGSAVLAGEGFAEGTSEAGGQVLQDLSQKHIAGRDPGDMGTNIRTAFMAAVMPGVGFGAVGMAGKNSSAGAASQPQMPGKARPVEDSSAPIDAGEVLGTIDAKAHEAATSPQNDLPEPTQAQKEAGNYKKGHVLFQGLNLSIENPAGSTRSGTDANGKAWENTMQSHYGYIKGTIGKDKDHVDAFVGSNPDSEKVFVIDQKRGNGHFDEHKVMLGFDTQAQAEAAYKANYAKDWDGIRAITEATMPEFKAWLKDGDTTKEFNPVGTRRIDDALRKKVADMTPDERAQALLTDDLTGLPNRRAYDEGDRRPVQTRLDLDGFKKINDTYGHGAGDDILRAVGKHLQDSRGNGTVYRIGGDEFPGEFDTTPEASKAMEFARQKVEAMVFTFALPDGSQKQISGVSFSYGTGQDAETAEQSLIADKAARKAAGLRKGDRDVSEGNAESAQGQQTGQGGVERAAEKTEVAKTPEQSGVVHLGHFGIVPPKDRTDTQSDRALTLKKIKGGYALMQGKNEAIDSDSGEPITYTSVDEAVADLKAELKRTPRRFLSSRQGIFLVPEFKASPAQAEPAKVTALPKNRKTAYEGVTPAQIEEISQLASEIGWAETGGKLLRNADGDAAGRTNWIAHSPFWPNRPEAIGIGIAKGAITRLKTGQPMSAIQKRFIDYAREYLKRDNETRAQEAVDLQKEAAAEALAMLPSAENLEADQLKGAVDIAQNLAQDKSWDDMGTPVSEEVGMRALGFTEDEINEARNAKEVQGHTGQSAAREAPGDHAGGAETGAGTAKEKALLTTPADAGVSTSERPIPDAEKPLQALTHAELVTLAKSFNLPAQGQTKTQLIEAVRSFKPDVVAERVAKLKAGLELTGETEAEIKAREKKEAATKEATENKRIADLERDVPLQLQGQDISSAARREAEAKRAQGNLTETPRPPELVEANAASAEFAKAQKAYRAGEIGDAEFLAAKAKMKVADDKYDAASGEAAKIEDFGEKIEGAKKELWQTYKHQMAEELPADAKDITLSKHFPEPNYEGLIAAGVDIRTLAAVKAMRDEIPTKPQRSFKVARWVAEFSTIRKLANSLISGERNIDDVLGKMREGTLTRFADRIEMYAELGYPAFKGAKDYTISSGWNDVKTGKQDNFALEYKGRIQIFNSRQEALDTLRAKLAAEAEQDNPRTVKLDLYRVTSSGDVVIGKKIAPGKFIDLKTGFKGPREARQYITDHYQELVDTLEKKKEVVPERRSINDPRVGEDYRKGENVTPDKFAGTFGFRGVQFGNYVEQSKRTSDLNNAYDSLLDLSNALNIPSRALSLNGTLGLAFGARGSGGKNAAAAHFEADKIVINLTKENGAGSLAHEWWHALDNYFGRQVGKTGDHLTTKTAERYSIVDAALIRPEVVKAYTGVVNVITATDMAKRSRELDGRRSKDYWSTVHEMTARAFESYIINRAEAKGQSNDYLANVVNQAFYDLVKEPNPYPTKEESKTIDAAFDHLFQTLQTKETDKGIAIQQERAQYGVETKRDEYTQDLFGNDLPATPARDRIDAAGTAAGVDGDLRPANRVRFGDPTEEQYATETRPETQRVIKSGFEQIQTPEQAAHVAAFLSRYPQENLTFIVADQSGKPLQIIRSSLGGPESAGFYPQAAYGAIHRVSGAANVWIAHNHPGGSANLSPADRMLTAKIHADFKDTGVVIKGILAIAGDQFDFAGTDYTKAGGEIPAVPRTFEIPVTERMFAKTGAFADTLRAPADIRSWAQANAGGKSGVLFMNSRNQPTGWLPMRAIDMSVLRTTGRAARLFKAIDKSNATQLALILPDESQENLFKSAGNLKELAKAVDVTFLDAFYGRTLTSASETGDSLGHYRSTFFSRLPATANAGLTREAFQSRLGEAFTPAIAQRLIDGGIMVPINNQSSAPKAVQQYYRTGDIIKGFKYNGKTYVVLSNVSADEVRGLAMHEIGVHFGMEAMLGKEKFASLLARVDDLVASGNAAAVQARATATQEASVPAHVQEETLAYLVHHHPTMDLAREIIAAIKAFLFKKFGIGAARLTDADMVMLARAAVKHAADGVVTEREFAPAFHRAYHGSPHDFDQFSTDHMGKGEGAQAYGWGMYFAGKREVADHYKKTLSEGKRGNDPELRAIWFEIRDMLRADDNLGFDTTGEAVQAILDHKDWRTRWDASKPDALQREVDAYAARSKAITGKLYEVELAPKEDQYLDWDQPINQQSEKVRAAIKESGHMPSEESKSEFMGSPVEFAPVTGAEFYKRVSQALGKPAGDNHPEWMRGNGMKYADDRAASEYLKSIGIPGIRYLDGSSRQPARYVQQELARLDGLIANNQKTLESGKDDGAAARIEGFQKDRDALLAANKLHHNYVIFDDKDVSVVAKFSRTSANTPEAPAPNRERSSGPLDATMKVLGGRLAAKYLTLPIYRRLIGLGRFIPEKVKAGLVADYGLPEPYIDRRDQTMAAQINQARQTGALVQEMSLLSRAQSTVAYQWMNQNEAHGDAIMVQLPETEQVTLRHIKALITSLGKEAVELGQLSKDAFEKNKDAYLHRTYRKFELEDDKQDVVARTSAIKVLGEQYKGRGLRDDVARDVIGHVEKGEKFTRYENRDKNGRIVKVHYLPIGKVMNQEMAAKFGDFHQAGTWEVRYLDKSGVVGMWRDFTPDELARMGEIDEVKFAVAKTLHMMVRDVEIGRFFKWASERYAKESGDGLNVVEAPTGRALSTFKKDDWIEVPHNNIPGTQTKAYGALAGKFIPAPMWNDLRQMSSAKFQPFGDLYNDVLKFWKLSKTAYSPATHMNNVMSNFIMADANDIGVTDVVRALNAVLRRNDEGLLERFKASGAEIGSFILSETEKNTIEPLIEELRREVDKADGSSLVKAASLVNLIVHGQGREIINKIATSRTYALTTKATTAMRALYQAEDSVFRLAAFIKATREGKTDVEAGKFARDSFLNYSINAPWIQNARATAFPFIAFSYRAVPLMLQTAANKPWKMLKYWALASALNAGAYAMLGGDGDDKEKKERALLPDEKAGKIWGVFPRLVRMPWNDQHSNPVFLDVRRWIPVGDVIDTDQNHAAIPIPQTLMPGGPLAMLAEMLLNKSSFTGQPITLNTDTRYEKASKFAGYFYKTMVPNNPAIYGSYSEDKIEDAGKGKTDPFGREYSIPQAVLSSIGVKVAAYPPDQLLKNQHGKLQHDLQELSMTQSKIEHQFAQRGMSKAEYDAQIDEIKAKKIKRTKEFINMRDGR